MEPAIETTDHALQEKTVEELYQPLFGFAMRLCGNVTEALDYTQQTFYLLQQHWSSIRDSSRLKSWLFTTLYREYLNRKKKRARHPHVDWEEAGPALPSIEASQATEMDATVVHETLQELEACYRRPLELFYLNDLSYKEIAERLEVPIGTVMSRLSRGKAELRKRLSDHIT